MLPLPCPFLPWGGGASEGLKPITSLSPEVGGSWGLSWGAVRGEEDLGE